MSGFEIAEVIPAFDLHLFSLACLSNLQDILRRVKKDRPLVHYTTRSYLEVHLNCLTSTRSAQADGIKGRLEIRASSEVQTRILSVPVTLQFVSLQAIFHLRLRC